MMSDVRRPFHSRRDFLCRSGMGLAALGLADLMASQGLLAAPAETSPRSTASTWS